MSAQLNAPAFQFLDRLIEHAHQKVGVVDPLPGLSLPDPVDVAQVVGQLAHRAGRIVKGVQAEGGGRSRPAPAGSALASTAHETAAP